ncbi:MAG: GAF domain-containing protein [Gammaproteobacteria bacterium]|nr:GAF domain-containing protein [Gammaproteobacteria bacterium]
MVTASPPFGQADLTNCERELLHLAGSVQPHGTLIVLGGPDLRIRQVTNNATDILGATPDSLLERPLTCLGGDLADWIRTLANRNNLEAPVPFRARTCYLSRERTFEAVAHRLPDSEIALELEPVDPPLSGVPAPVSLPEQTLLEQLNDALRRIGAASTVASLADVAVRCVKELTGYDRVMVYKFDPDGHGKIIAESRDPRLDSLLGHHYPASDIPQRARQLYLRTRTRVLVDVHYEPVPLVPRLRPRHGDDLDMSLSQLRSMSPLHLQYLKNMGVTATLVVSLVRDGALWGLIACHHYAPRNLRYPVRAAAELLGEVLATRLAAIENYAQAQVAILVRRLEQRLIEATATEGDWRLALFRNPRTLLQPLDATGAALVYAGEIQTVGEVPSTPELRALVRWIDEQAHDVLFSSASVGRDNPELQSLTPTASGILSVKLSRSRPDYLIWMRKEQLLTVTWAGDPSKPVLGDDPLDLSPRRSFAAWSEIVRGTASPWSKAELSLARALGGSLADIIVQVHGVRLLIARHQLDELNQTVESAQEAVIIADARGRLLTVSDAFTRLAHRDLALDAGLEGLSALFAPAERAATVLDALGTEHRPWRGELALVLPDGEQRPVTLRAEVISGREGAVLGFILVFMDLTDNKRAAAARRQLERSLSLAAPESLGVDEDTGLAQPARDLDEVIGAILSNASLAAMEVADAASSGPEVAPLLEELEASTRRAAALYRRIRSLGEEGEEPSRGD